MKVSPATTRITFSICVIALKYLPNFSKLNAITNANKITGTPVPNEKTTGMYNFNKKTPYEKTF